MESHITWPYQIADHQCRITYRLIKLNFLVCMFVKNIQKHYLSINNLLDFSLKPISLKCIHITLNNIKHVHIYIYIYIYYSLAFHSAI